MPGILDAPSAGRAPVASSAPRAIHSPMGEIIVIKANATEPGSGTRHVYQTPFGTSLDSVTPGSVYAPLPKAQSGGVFDIVVSHDSSQTDVLGAPWNDGGHHIGVALNWASVTDFALIQMMSANNNTFQASIKIGGTESVLLNQANPSAIPLTFGQKVRMQCSLNSGCTSATMTWTDYLTGTVMYTTTIALAQGGRSFRGVPAFHTYSAKGTFYHPVKVYDANSSPTAAGSVWAGVSDNGSSVGAGLLSCNGLATMVTDGSVRVKVLNASAGTWTPSVTPNAGSPTNATAVAYNASAATLQTSLQTVIAGATVIGITTGEYLVGGLAGGTVALGTNSLTGTGATVDISGSTPSSNWGMALSPVKMKNGTIRGVLNRLSGRMMGVMVRQSAGGAGYCVVYDNNTTALLLKSGQSNAIANVGSSFTVPGGLTAGVDYPFEINLRDDIIHLRLGAVNAYWSDVTYASSGFVGIVGFGGIHTVRDLVVLPSLDTSLVGST